MNFEQPPQKTNMPTAETLDSRNESNHTNIDERESTVIREAKYFEPYKDELRDLFVALGRQDKWSEDPTNSDFLSYMRSGWIGAEHGNSTEKDQFTEEQMEAAMPILEKLGLTTELLPDPSVEVEQTILVGGTMTANYRRTVLIQKAIDDGMNVGEVLCWYGQRPRESRDGKNADLAGTTGAYAGHDTSDNPWYKAHVAEALESDDPWALTETDFGRIALNKVTGGNLQPHKITLPLIEANGEPTGIMQAHRKEGEEVPHREVLDYHFATDEGFEVVLVNNAAADRRDRPSRHTTKSSTVEWLERYAPSHGAKVMYVTGNPHSVRTAQDTYKILNELGRGDIELIVAGTGPAANSPIQSYLGEVARLIDNDVKRNY